MIKLDYTQIGLKIGLEIHQQLDTKKLFCNCPSTIKEGNHDFMIKRRLRAIAGETGEIDVAARLEQEKSKEYLYECYKDITCLVELDEEPPHEMNQEALKIVYEAALMLKAELIDEIQIMRKTVVDGSNTSGFQRTALVAMNGHIETEQGEISVPTICIEEDAAKIVKKTKEHDIYNLSRLGIPLIEIATGPDIKTPEQAREVAEKIGMILRSTNKVKRGIGTIRQDLNISIKGGARVEIKGAQELRLIPKLIEYEALRQKNLLEYKDKKIKISNIIDITEILKETKCRIFRNIIDNSGAILGIKIDDFKGLIGNEICPGKRFGTELSDYAKTKAGVSGLFHSDEDLKKYNLIEYEIKQLMKKLECKDNDAFIMIGDNKEVAEKALKVVIERLHNLKEIPEEVRRANIDATTTFMRPMPGSARMYPETDIPAIKTETEEIKVSELVTDKIARLQEEYTLSKDLASLVAKKEKIFLDFMKHHPKVKPVLVAETLINTPKELKKRYSLDIPEDKYLYFLHEILSRLNKNEINADAILDILVELGNGKEIDYSKYKPLDEKDVEKTIKEIIEKNKGANFGALMGIAMDKFKGKVTGNKVSEIIKKLMP
jgi:glutamyl-tRNA(Gln) amidotransferase subunit E